MTTRKNHHPRLSYVPGEPNVEASYVCLPQRGQIVDRTGNGYDLTQTGTARIGQGYGILYDNETTNYYAGNIIPVTSPDLAYMMYYEMTTTCPGLRYCLGNQGHYMYGGFGDLVEGSLDGGGTLSATTYSVLGRGPLRAALLFDGTDQILMVNGDVADQDAVTPAALGGWFRLGRHGNVRGAKVWNAQRTPAQERAEYVEEFASRILWQWTPHREIASIATGTTGGDDDWWCPLGAATMDIVWRPDLSHPAGGRHALTDTQAVNLNRIEFPFRRPWFGSWLVEYEVRDPATDSMVVGFAPTRGVDPTAAGSNAYWLWVRTAAGPWWRAGVQLANGVQIDAADAPFPGPVAGDRCKVLFSRAVDGTIQVWQYTPAPIRGWWWSVATGNDVNVLEEGFISLAPRGSYIERVTYFQGEMTPHELGLAV